MPLFEYRCRACGNEFEYLVLRSSPPAECPACHAHDPDQLVSLCAMSSEQTRAANLSAAHARAASIRQDRHRDQHSHLHEHFEDSKTSKPDQ
jgi:putative FmdB family regulatory protein